MLARGAQLSLWMRRYDTASDDRGPAPALDAHGDDIPLPNFSTID